MAMNYYQYKALRVPHESVADNAVMWCFYRFPVVLWEQSGLPFILQKAKKLNSPDPHPTLFLWLLTIYVALYGLATQKHESRRDRIDNKIATLTAQLGTPARDAALSRVADLQQSMAIPIEPHFLEPWTAFETLFGEEKIDNDLMDDVKSVTSSILKSLEGTEGDGLSLAIINLSSVNLNSANLSGVELLSADLREADLRNADLNSADLSNANLTRADLTGADLTGSDLTGANLTGANLFGAKLIGANLNYADLRLVKYLICGKLKKARNWSCTYRDPDMECGEPIPVDVRTCRRW